MTQEEQIEKMVYDRYPFDNRETWCQEYIEKIKRLRDKYRKKLLDELGETYQSNEQV